MDSEPGVLPFALDLTRGARRSVTSLYSNLVTRPTGRAVRMGLESQLAEMHDPGVCISVLDFSSVRVLDYSCADEIVAKLLLRFHQPEDRGDVYLIVRGLQDHHQDSIEAVLERHNLVLVAEQQGGWVLLGPTNPVERACWNALLLRGRAPVELIAADLTLAVAAVSAALQALVAHRVAIRLRGSEMLCAVPTLLAS